MFKRSFSEFPGLLTSQSLLKNSGLLLSSSLVCPLKGQSQFLSNWFEIFTDCSQLWPTIFEISSLIALEWRPKKAIKMAKLLQKKSIYADLNFFAIDPKFSQNVANYIPFFLKSLMSKPLNMRFCQWNQYTQVCRCVLLAGACRYWNQLLIAAFMISTFGFYLVHSM